MQFLEIRIYKILFLKKEYVALDGMQDLIFLTRDKAHASCIQGAES